MSHRLRPVSLIGFVMHYWRILPHTRGSGGSPRLALVGLILLLCSEAATATEQESPPIKPGTWELKSVRLLPNGKAQTWTQRIDACVDPSLLFEGYWGLGILEVAGCRFESTRLSDTQYKVDSYCMVRGAGNVRSEGTVILTGGDAFDLDIHVREGKRNYRGKQHGHRVADCRTQ